MKPSFLFLLIFILALCQATFLSLNLVLLVTLFWAAFQPPSEAFKIAFFAGLLLDLALGSPLGLSSSFFLVATLILKAYSRRFDPAHPLFLPFFITLSSLAFSRLIEGNFAWTESFWILILTLVVHRIKIGRLKI